MLDETSSRPFNPMVNAGAIATADLVGGKDLTERTRRLLAMFRRYCGREVHLDTAVFLSERSTGHRNRAIARLMLNPGMINPRVEDTLQLYFQQCSVLVSCRDLALMGATLANRRVNPATGEVALEARYAKYLPSPAGGSTQQLLRGQTPGSRRARSRQGTRITAPLAEGCRQEGCPADPPPRDSPCLSRGRSASIVSPAPRSDAGHFTLTASPSPCPSQ